MRAKPDRSPDAAARHLFRHLWDPGELRRNPIVGELFAGLPAARDTFVAEGIRASVRRLAETSYREDLVTSADVARRRRDIVIRGDLERESRDKIATDLGISARQYTRDQHFSRARIVALLNREFDAPARLAVEDSGLRSLLARIALLAGLGMPAEAIAASEQAVRSADDDATVVSTLCLRSTIQSCHFGNYADARATLDDAKSIVERWTGDSFQGELARAEVDLAVARLDATCGKFADAVRRSAGTYLFLAGAQKVDPRTWRLLAAAASFHAYAAQLRGSAKIASDSLHASLSAYDQATDWLAYERAEFFLQTGVTLKALAQWNEASHYLREASAIARDSGLIVQAMETELPLGVLLLNRGDLQGSRAILLRCRAEAERVGHAATRSGAHLYLARGHTQASSPNARAIIGEVERVTALCPPESPHWIDAKTAESFGRLLMGDLAAADRAARDADDAAVSSGCFSLRSGTLREIARIAHAQRRPRDARRTIRQAIDVAHTAGKLADAARNHELAAAILASKNHRYEAAALRRHLVEAT